MIFSMENNDPPRMAIMVVWSFILHLLVIAGGGVWKIAPSPRLTFGPVYEVKLVDRIPSSPMDYGGTSEGLWQPSRSTVLGVKREALNFPVQRLERETTKNEGVKKALEQIKQRATTTPLPAPSGGTEEGAINSYLRLIWERIKGGWTLPPGVFPSENWQALVHLRILKNGKLTEVKLAESSGNTYFDRSVLRAIQKADPLPPFPAGIHEDSIEVGIRFHSHEAEK